MSRVIQLSSMGPIAREDYITKGDLYEDLDSIEADYVADIDDMTEEEMDDEIFSILHNALPEGVFAIDRKARTITVKPEGERDYSAINKWWDSIREKVNSISAMEAVCDHRACRYKIKEELLNFGNHDVRFYYDTMVYHPTSLIEALLCYAEGPVHIGGEVDYHF